MIRTDYMEREDQRRIDRLQAYVTKQGLSSSDASEVTEWVDKQSVVAIQVYKGGYLVYDSNYPEEEFEEGAPDRRHPKENFHTVVFSDGKADVLLYGFYDYQFYNYAFIGELLLSFLLLMGDHYAGHPEDDLVYPETEPGNQDTGRRRSGLSDHNFRS